MRESVTQKDDFGCGAACVAFRINLPYDKAVQNMGQTQAATKGFTCKELCAALGKLDENYQLKYLKERLKRKIYHDGVIVFVKRSPRYPYGHYLIRHDGMWMDSWMNLPHDKQVKNARSGFRKRLPGKPIYALFPV